RAPRRKGFKPLPGFSSPAMSFSMSIDPMNNKVDRQRSAWMTSRGCGCHRRDFLRSALACSLVLPAIHPHVLAGENDPPASRPSHFPAKAKHVIFLFMTGGVSHVDSFDPKPALTRDHGKEIKADHPEIKDRPGYERIFLKKPQWDFAPHGKCGTE